MDKIFTKIFGSPEKKWLQQYQNKVHTINALEPVMKGKADDELKAMTDQFKSRLAEGETLDEILPEAFAVVRETAWRTLKMRHFDVQLIGGMVLHDGRIAEMRTGEGKTLMSTLAAYLNALSGKGVHLVTVNDYLAKRDADWMGQIYHFLGLSVAVINGSNTSFLYTEAKETDSLDEKRDETGSFKIFKAYLEPCTRSEAYKADITYGTNNEFGFDYLRDNTQRNVYGLSQRGHSFVIIDEIDSILIDEARVPLIISSQAAEASDTYMTFAKLAKQMVIDEDYEVDEKLRAVSINDQGISKAEKALGVDNIYSQENVELVHHLEIAVKAQAAFTRDIDYVVKDKNVVIVDPFTGRLQDGRRYSEGLHQALEAKEGVPVQQESKTVASITYQNYFKFYDKLSGMTGTAVTSEEEFRKVYALDVLVIPTNKPIARIDQKDLIFRSEMGKFKAIARKIKELNKTGQPVLVGSASIEKNELLSRFLLQEGVKHQMLNAKNHEAEGEIIAQAGRKGAVTLATNMAGRGVDIKLGGNPCTSEEEQEIKDLGGLYVLGTERHDARRIDDQLRGRAGRQGDPGETQFFVSVEDQLMRVFGKTEQLAGLLKRMNLAEDEAIQNSMFSRSLEKAQERIEGFHFDSRKHVLEYDNVISQQREAVYGRRRKILKKDQDTMQELLDEVHAAFPDSHQAIEAKKEALTDNIFWQMFGQGALQFIDRLWMQHLEVMQRARSSVNLRAYGQREPLVEYKKEALRLYDQLQATLRKNLHDMITRLDAEKINQQINQQRQAVKANREKQQQVKESQNTELSSTDTQANTAIADKVAIRKKSASKIVKRKKLQAYLDAGWEVVSNQS